MAKLFRVALDIALDATCAILRRWMPLYELLEAGVTIELRNVLKEPQGAVGIVAGSCRQLALCAIARETGVTLFAVRQYGE